jgi:ribosomal protein S18 acetylase RimI-like enzyme
MRKLEIDIIEAKCYLYNDEFLRILARSMYQPTPQRLQMRANRYHNKPDSAVFAAICQEHICGIIVADIVSLHSITILDVAVAETMEHRGIGKAMILHLIDEYHPVEIYAQTDEAAVGFYRRIGFEVSQAEEKYKGVTRYNCIYPCNYIE